MSRRIIKATNVTFSEEAQIIDVPSKNFFNPNINSSFAQQDGEFIPSNYGGADESEEFLDEQDDFIDPEKVIKMAEQESQNIIAGANKEADSIIQRAKLKVEEEKATAREQGRAEGYELGIQQAKAEYEHLLEETNQVLKDAINERNDIIEAIEPDLVNFMCEIINKLIGDAFVLNPEVIKHIINSGVLKVSDAPELTVRVSKSDFDTAVSLKDEIMQMVDSDTAVAIVKDTGLNQGDCVIDTPIGSIDSSINKQWQSLKNDLFIILKE